MIEETTTPALCVACGSNDVECRAEYYTTGGDMEHVEFTHRCRACGHSENAFQQGCFGYDNTYHCPLPHAMPVSKRPRDEAVPGM